MTGDVAGGFTADFQSGTVDNSSREANDFYAVYNLDVVNGQSYAGGFAGRAYSGALADASKGISILGGLTGVNINLSDLLSVINAYVPYIQYAGVKSDNGFTVTATKLTEDTTVGSAGGFVGYASGAQISYSDVTKLKHTIVTPRMIWKIHPPLPTMTMQKAPMQSQAAAMRAAMWAIWTLAVQPLWAAV